VTHGISIFYKTPVISTQTNGKNDDRNIVEGVDPLATLRLCATNL
jgi:hypothetical protein